MKKVSVTCRNLGLAYGANVVLRDVNLAIEPGEFFALLGPSGSGKSTLLRAIAGFARHDQGELLIDGQDVGALPPWRRKVGMVFQNYALWPHLTVWDNVAFGLVERRESKAAITEKVGAALELVGLAAFGQRRPNQLSGGQQQRVALARTIVIEPQVLLLDEPLSNLDRGLRVSMRRELLAMQRRLGLTTIFVTHDQEEAMTTADRMAVLDRGVLQQVGTPAALYDEPVNAFVAGFVGTMNLLPARVLERGAARWRLAVQGLGELLLAPPAAGEGLPDEALLSCRPHALHLQPAGAARDERQAWFAGSVEASEFVGEFVRHHVRAGTHSLAVDQPHRAGQLPLAPGAAVEIGFDSSQLRLLAR